MCNNKTSWERTVEFHGHSCPGLAIGFRAAELAMEALRSNRSADEEMIAIVENNSCGIDAVQALAGCSFGKGNLYFLDYGKQVYTFALRGDGCAVRVAVKYGTTYDPEFVALKERANSSNATEKEKELFKDGIRDRVQKLLTAGPEVFDIKEVYINLPERASVYQTLQCAECLEGVMEPRTRLKEGRIVCIPCAG